MHHEAGATLFSPASSREDYSLSMGHMMRKRRGEKRKRMRSGDKMLKGAKRRKIKKARMGEEERG